MKVEAYDLFCIINAAGVMSSLLECNWVRSADEFKEFNVFKFGLPILVPANSGVFKYSETDVFRLSEQDILNKIYKLKDPNYVGYTHAFATREFVKSYEVKEGFLDVYHNIIRSIKETFHAVNSTKASFGTVGAFQTRNIPHLGHQKIIEEMLNSCDHVVINPVIGPKKSGDVSEEVLKDIYNFLSQKRFNGHVSFLPIYSNMFYAGPLEALHHAHLRQRLGFDLFSIGRDHAGAQAMYDANAAVSLLSQLRDNFNISLFLHDGAVYCSECDAIVLRNTCTHSPQSLKDVSGSEFRNKISERKNYIHADIEIQKHLFDNKLVDF